MVSVLAESFPFQEGARKTGIWSESNPAVSGTENLVGFYFIQIPSDQDVELEAYFLSPFLPFEVGGLYGNSPDGSQWIIFAMVGPSYKEFDGLMAESPLSNFQESLDRALSFNLEAHALADRLFSHEELMGVYTERVKNASLADWPTSDLALGLIAEICDVPLEQIVAGYSRNCAYPDADHECQSNVFLDVFASWQSRIT